MAKERIFVSYKRDNSALVTPLVDRISRELGIECWMDKTGIESSAQFRSKICKAIDNCEVVLFMYSSIHLTIDYDNDWTVKELDYAQAKKKTVILINIDKASLDNLFLLEFGSKNNIDATIEEQVSKLITDLREMLGLNKMTSQTSLIEDNIEKNVGNVEKNQIRQQLEQQGVLAEKGEDGFPVNIQKAIEYYKQAEELGSGLSCYRLGHLYYEGRGVRASLKKAFEYFKKGYELQDFHAQHCYAKACIYGEGTSKSLRKGIDALIENADEHSFVPSMILMGNIYENGDAGELNYDKAVRYYLNAVHEKDAEGELAIGDFYLNPDTGKYSKDQALKYYRLSANQGNAEACCKYARLTTDEAEALKYYKKASKGGNDEATKYLDALKDYQKGKRNTKFLFKVNSIERTSGTVVTGTFVSGYIKTGDEVYIYSPEEGDDRITQTIIANIIKKGENVDFAFSGESVSLRFLRLREGRVCVGDEIMLVSQKEQCIKEEEYLLNDVAASDFKKISLNGGDMLSKGRFAHAVVSEYIAKYPRLTFTELENVFRADFLGSGFRQYGIVHLLNDELNKWKDPQRRFFLEQDDVLTLSDGTEFVVCTQWTKYSIKYIVDIAKGEGWNVSVLGEENNVEKDTTEGVQFPLNLMILPKEYGKSDFDKEFLEMIAAVVYLDEVKLQQMIDSQWYKDNLQNVMHAASRDIKLMPMSLHNIVQCWDICINSNMYINLTLSNDDNRNVYSEKVERIRKILKEHFVHSDDKVDFVEQKSLILGMPENLPSFKGLRQIDMELIKSVYNLDFEMTSNMLSYGANPWIEIEDEPCVWDMVANNIYNINGILQQTFDNHSVSAQDCADTIALILACAAWNEMSMYMAGQCPFTTGKRKPKNMYGQHMAIYQSTAPGYVSPEIHVELYFNPEDGRATSYYMTSENEVKGLRTPGKDVKRFFEMVEDNDFINRKYFEDRFFDKYENGDYILTVVTRDGAFNRVQVGKNIVASDPIYAFVEKLADKAREKRGDANYDSFGDDDIEDEE